MAVWDQLQAVLARLRDEQPSPLLGWPDPHGQQELSPPFRIRLAASAVVTAEELHRRFGENVVLTVGRLPYPPGRRPEYPLDRLTRQPPGELLNPSEAEVALEAPAIVRTGETLRLGLLVRNLTDRQFSIATNGQVTALIVDPQTGQVVGGSAGAQLLVGIYFRVAPQATERIPLLIATASFRPELGYTVPPGSWGMQVPLVLQRDLFTGEDRLTPILPLAVTS
jgi:hypothetical protein